MELENLRCYSLIVRGIKFGKTKRLSMFNTFKSKYPGIFLCRKHTVL